MAHPEEIQELNTVYLTMLVAEQHRMIRSLVNNELERMWKEVVMAQFKVISLRLSGGTEEDHGKPRLESRSLGRDLNLEPPQLRSRCANRSVHLNICFAILNGA
jgi:hypothetical protein